MAGFLGGFRSMASVGVRIIVLPKPPLDHRPIPVPSRRGSTVQPIALCGVPHNSQQFIRAVPDDADEFFFPIDAIGVEFAHTFRVDVPPAQKNKWRLPTRERRKLTQRPTTRKLGRIPTGTPIRERFIFPIRRTLS